MAYGTQLRALLLKNFLLVRRSFGGLAVQLAAPLVINVLLYLSDRTSESNGGFFRDGLDTPVPAVERLSTLPRCISIAYPDTCVSFGYTPDTAVVSGWVAAAATAAGIPSTEVRGFPSESALNTFLVDHPNRTVAAYVFEDRDLTTISTGSISYVVQFNETRHDEFPVRLRGSVGGRGRGREDGGGGVGQGMGCVFVCMLTRATGRGYRTVH